MKIRYIIYVFCTLIYVSCGSKASQHTDVSTNTSKSQHKGSLSDNTDASNNDNRANVQIGVKVFVEKGYNEDLNYEMEEKDEELYVNPTGYYFNRYISNNRLILEENDYETYYSYPIVELFIVNNTEESFNIKELDMEIAQSKLDNFPYLYFFCCKGLSYCIPILNESWSDWGNMVLKYKILRAGEKFDGTYDKKKVIPYFEDYMLIDFASDIRNMGLDESKLAPYIVYREEALGVYPRDCLFSEGESENDFNRYAYFEEKEVSYDTMKELFYPFNVDAEGGYGYAWLYGQVSFTKHSFKKNIKTQILITYPGLGGADVELDEEFNVQLETNKSNYIKRLPYVTAIAPHGNERIRIKVRCDKSTHHDFTIKAKNSNDIDISTKPIHFYYLNTPHTTIGYSNNSED